MKTRRIGRWHTCAIVFAAMVAASVSWAVEVTPEQATTAAGNWIKRGPARVKSKFRSTAAKATVTSRDSSGRVLYHAVNLEGGGFVVTSGDTRLTPVVAFSDTGCYRDDKDNPLYVLLQAGRANAVASLNAATNKEGVSNGRSAAESEWRSLLSDQQERVSNSTGSASSVSVVYVDKLIKTKWGQDSWDGYVDGPSVFNYSTPNNYVCGCVATVGAQIMRFWQYPTAEIPQFSNACAVDDSPVTRYSIAGAFNWANMPLSAETTPTVTEAQKEAIGMLTYNVGVAVGMSWHSGSSGASPFALPNALETRFGYQSGGIFVQFDAYLPLGYTARAEALRNALYASLDAGMPVCVSIQGSVSGHAVIADGYGSILGTSYTHLNMGWAGIDDAWYDLSDALPGPGTSTYSVIDGLVFNIHPTEKGDVISGRVWSSGGANLAGATVTLRDSSDNLIGTTTTSESGVYSFRVTTTGKYYLKATYNSVSSDSTEVNMSALNSSGTYDMGGFVGNKWGVNLKVETAVMADAYDPGDDTAAGGTPLTPTDVEQTHGPHTLSATDSQDFFRIEMTSGTKYVFESTGGGGLLGELFSSASADPGSCVTYSSTGAVGNNFKIEYFPPSDGTYYLRVSGYGESVYSLKYSALALSTPSTYLRVEGYYPSVNCTLGSEAINFMSKIDCDGGWTVSVDDTSWVTLTTDCGVGDGYFYFSLPENTGYNRSCVFTVTAGSFTAYKYLTQYGPLGADPRKTVTFNANGGSVSPTTRTVESGASVGALPTPTRDGWTFTGWFTEVTGGTPVSAATQVTEDVTYYAQWTLDPDAFDPGDDSAAGGTLLTPTTTEQTHGPHKLSSTDLYDFFRVSMTAGTTYVFETTGSSDTIGDLYSSTAANDESLVATHDDIDIDHDNRNFRIEYTPTVSQIYYLRVKAFNNSDASYSLKYSCNASAPVQNTVTFNANGGSVSPTTRTVASGASVGTLPTPTRTGWTFTGWFTAETGGTQVSAATQVTRDVTYYAQWTTSSDAFDPGDDTAAGGTLLTPTTTEQTHGPHTLSSTDLNDFFRISMTAGVTYVFEATGSSDTIGELYSSTAANDGSLVVSHDDIDIAHDNRNFRIEYTPTVSQTYYLRVKAFNDANASYSLKYSCSASAPVQNTVTFNANGGSVSPTTRTVASGASVGTLPTPTRTGWTFTGWFTALTGGTQVSAATQVTRDVTYYAQWTQNPGPDTPTPVDPGPDTPTPVDPEPGPSCYAALDAAEIVAPYEAPKAVTLQGVAYSGCGVAGVIELKLGKVNARKHTSKVSGSVTMLNGKKYTITAVTLAGVDGSAPIDVSLNVKSLGTMAVTIGGRQFAGSLSGWHVQSANVGGNWTRSGAEVYVDMTSATLPDGVLEDLLPDGEPVVASGGKWKFAKAASVKWAKPKRGAPEPDIFDEASGKGLIVDTSAGKTNLSGLKLTYTPKKGTFKGSFKMYALQGSGRTTKLKKYTVNVNGIVVDGVGYGTATCKSPSFSCPVTVE